MLHRPLMKDTLVTKIWLNPWESNSLGPISREYLVYYMSKGGMPLGEGYLPWVEVAYNGYFQVPASMGPWKMS